MKLIISSYPGTDVKLYLVDGLPYRHMHQHPTFFFNNLNSLLLHLNQYVSVNSIWICFIVLNNTVYKYILYMEYILKNSPHYG